MRPSDGRGVRADSVGRHDQDGANDGLDDTEGDKRGCHAGPRHERAQGQRAYGLTDTLKEEGRRHGAGPERIWRESSHEALLDRRRDAQPDAEDKGAEPDREIAGTRPDDGDPRAEGIDSRDPDALDRSKAEDHLEVRRESCGGPAEAEEQESAYEQWPTPEPVSQDATTGTNTTDGAVYAVMIAPFGR